MYSENISTCLQYKSAGFKFSSNECLMMQKDTESQFEENKCSDISRFAFETG